MQLDSARKQRRPQRINVEVKLQDGEGGLDLSEHVTNSKTLRDQELRFTVHDSPDYYHLKVSVFNDDKKTDLVGETRINLQDVIVPGGGQNDLWHNLNCKGKYAGEIRIEITYYDTRPKDESLSEKRREPNNSRGSLNEMTRESLGGPRQLIPAKRRPLPEDPTLSTRSSMAFSPLETAYPEQHIQTPPRSYREGSVPNTFQPAYKDGPNILAQHRYSLPPANNFHSYDAESPYETPAFAPSQQRASQYPPRAGFDPSQRYPQEFSYDHRGADLDGPPPLPPAHSARHTSPNLAVTSRPVPNLPHANSAPPALLEQQIESHNHPSGWQGHRGGYSAGSSGYEQDQYRHRGYDIANMQPRVEDDDEYLPPNLRNRTSERPLTQDPRVNGFDSRDAYPLSSSSPYALSTLTFPQTEADQIGAGSSTGVPSSLVPGYDPRIAPRMSPSRQDPSLRSSISNAPITPQRAGHNIIERQQLGSSPTKPSPLREDTRLDQSSVPASRRRSASPDVRVPMRKSVSPSPYSTPGGEKRLSGIPFSPDSYDALNPNAGSSPPLMPAYNTPDQAREAAKHSRASTGPIRTSGGRIIDPSDHLPSDTWAPEPDRKSPTKSSSYSENRPRPSPNGAEPMSASARPGFRDSGARPLSNPTPIYAHSSGPQTPTNYGRNRLQKKSKGPPSPPRGSASSPYSFGCSRNS